MLMPTHAHISGVLGEEIERAVGTRSFIIKSPIPTTCNLPCGTEPCYLIDLSKLDDDTFRRLAVWVAQRFHDPVDEIVAEMRARGAFPIRESQCVVSFDMRLVM